MNEIAVTITGGKDKANWDNILSRTLTSGIDGALSAVILAGASVGVGSAINVTNKLNNNVKVTDAEIQQAVRDTQRSGKVNVENIIQKSISAVKDNFVTPKVTSKTETTELPVINERFKTKREENTNIETNIEKAPTAENNLIRGINKRTNNNLELNLDTLPTARAKIENNRITLDRENGRLEDIIHEATHYSESNSKGYETLKNHVLSELKKDENFEEIKNSINELYTQQYQSEGRTFTERDLENELVAKYTERFISDESFVNKMTKADRNLAQKIYDWIKDKVNYYKKIVKMEPEQITEYDNLRKAEKLWEKALKGTKANNNTKYAMEKSSKYGQYWNVETKKDIFRNINDSKTLQDVAYKYILNGNINFDTIIDKIDGKNVEFRRVSAKEYVYGRNNKKLQGNQYQEKMRTAPSIDDLIENASIQYHSPLTHPNKLFPNGFDNFQGKVGIDNDIFSYIVRVGKDKNNSNVFYDLSLEFLGQKKADNKVLGVKNNSSLKSALTNNSISQNNNTVNNKSMQNSQKNTLSTAKNNQAPRYSIAGKKGMQNAIRYDSNNIELERMYNRAKALQMNGVDNETIRKQTSWFQDKNGDWKFEFTDKQMSLKNNIKLKANTSYKLGDILQHNTLFMVYPQLKNYNVFISEIGNKSGSFSNKYKTIRLSNELLKDTKSIEGTLIHEIQHAIQHIEGFEGGRRANKSRLAYLNSLGEIEATDTKNRFYAEKYEHKNINNIAPESSKTNPQHAKLESYLKNRGIIDKIKDGVYNYFETKNKNGDESYDYTQNKNGKRQIDNKNSEDVLQARGKDVGKIWDRLGSEEGRRINNQELDNSSSFSTDNKGRKLTREQQEYFKDSKVRDENGNLLEVYHGTEANVGIPEEHWFTIFDIDRAGDHGSMLGDGFYFTSNKSHAEQYAHTKGNIYTTYLNITNPLELDNFSTGELVYAIRKINPFIEADIYKRNGTIDGYKVRRYLLNNGYDGVHSGNTYVAFNSNQIKNIDNLNPTDSSDIRYSLNNEEKKKYAKYKNDTTDYKNDMIDKALEIVKPNSQGRRTKEQWLNVADYIGKDLDGLSEVEVEKIAYRSWFDLAPNQKDQLNRQGKSYVSFGVNEWVSKVTDSYKKTRTVSDNGTTYTLDKFYNENIDNFNNIEEAERTFDEFYNIQLNNKQNESNVAKKAVRTKSVAMKASDTQAPKNIRQFYDNVQTSGAIDKDLKKLVNPKEYRKISNEETMNKAIIKLADDSTEATKWLGRVSREDYKPSSIDVAEGLVLLAKYQSEKNYESAVDVIDNLAKMGTKGGQTVQMFALLQRLTPDGMLVYAQRSLQRAMELDSKNKSQEWIDKHKEEYELTPEDNKFITERMEKVQNMKDGREKEILLGEIQKRITDKLPPEKGSGIKSYMRISMLFNPKTQIRNIMGNALIAPVNAVADTFGAVADRAISKRTGIRTKGITDVKSVAKGTVTGVYKSFDDFRRGIDTRNLAGDRFEIGENGRKNFSDKTRLGRAMNSLDRTLSFFLDLGDRPFYESAFVNSINNQMKLNKVNVPTAEMVEIATTEALQRTWQDNNGYTNAVLKIRDILNGNFRYGIGDWLIPFAKTPANLTKAIVDYSPPGLVKTLIKDAKELRNAVSRNDKDIAKYQHKFVDNLGKGMAGSFLYIIGYALAQSGVITGDNDEDKDVANFMRNTLGVQPYSIRIGDTSFTYDWAQPVAAPLGIMANIANKDNEDASVIDKAWDSFTTATSMLVSQSFMQSINELFSSYGDWQENLLNVALELPARAVPTFLKQIADMVDSTQRTSFDKSDKLATAKNKVIAKLPIASKTLAPTVDTLGREVKKYGGDNSIFNVFFNPANTNKGQYTESAEEIYNLYKQTGDKTIFPIQAPYSVTINEETTALDAKTRANYQKATGQYTDDSVKRLLTSRDYKNLSNEEKVKILKNVIEDSNLTAKKEILNYTTDDETQKEKSKETGISLPNMYICNKIIKDIESKKDSSGETIKGSRQASMAEYIMAMKVAESQKNKLLAQMTESENKVTVSDLETVGMENYTQFLSISNANSKDKYKRLVATGINSQELNKYWNNINDVEGEKDENGKTISGSKKRAVQNYINSLNISSGEKLLLYASTGNYSLTYAEKMELFNYINSISGMSNNEKQELVDSLKCFQ